MRKFNPTANCERHFCGVCGTHVFTEDARMPHIFGIPAGVLGVSFAHRPTKHYFVDHKAEWHAISDNIPQFGGESGMERLDV